MTESARIGLGLRTDRRDNESISETTVEPPPWTAAGARTKLTKLGGSLDLAAMRKGKLVAIDHQLLECVLHRVPFPLRKGG